MASQNECAAHIFMTTARFREIVAAGVVTKQPNNMYELDVVREEYIKHMRTMAQATGYRGQASGLTEERARLAKEQADAKEMENEVSRGKLVQIEDVAEVVENQFNKVRQKLLAIPSKTAPEIHAAPDPTEARKILEQAIVDTLNELVGINQADAAEEA